jgi:ATP-dependent helicase/nuclease subunit A
VRRGLSCAILVQKNQEGEALVDALRARIGIPVVSESEIFIATDNPLNRALLAVFQVAAHPGDRFAWQHLAMGPLRTTPEVGEGSPEAFSSRLLAAVFEEGFEASVRIWTDRFEAALGSPLDTYTRGRAEEFALAARSFDESGSRDLDEFLLFLGKHRIRETVSSNAVQVMTIHKSKGLTFDAVILPDLGGNSLTTARRSFGVKKNGAREVEWILDLPRKEFVEADPVLREHAAEREAEAAYEALCKFYVAMTRASRANYLITMPRGDSATSQNFVKLLEDTLATDPLSAEFGGVPATVLYQSHTAKTNRRWFEAFHPSAAAEESAPKAVRGVDPALARKRLRRRTPSGSEDFTVTAAQIFTPAGSVAREFGTLVHALFEEIEWSGECDFETLAARRRETRDATTGLEDALEQVCGVLNDPVAAAALARPGDHAEAWRERSFEILLGEEWLSGTFDRVVIERTPAGVPERATILDFKTDRVATLEEIDAAVTKYRPQLETYREVLRRITGLPATSIRCRLLFTRSRSLREV